MAGEITPVGASGPEQNALLALRLFAPVGQNIQDANQQRLSVLGRLAQIANQQRFQQQQRGAEFAQQANLESMRNNNSVALENLRMRNSQTLADKEFDRQHQENIDILARQKAVGAQAQTAIDQRDLHKQFSLSYPVYAQAASVLGKKPNAANSYAMTWEGIGQLQADMEELKTEASKKQQMEGAKGVIAILDQSTDQLKQAIAARDTVAKLSAEDQAQARSQGLQALQAAAQTGSIPGLDASSQKYKAAVAALNKDQPDLGLASQILGPTGIQVFATGVRQGLQALTNDKDRLARIAAASREVSAAQRGSAEQLNRLATLTVNNPYLGTMLSDRSQTIQGLNNQAAGAAPAASAPDAQSIFNRLTGLPAAGATAAAGATGVPLPRPGTPAALPNPTGDQVLGDFNQNQAAGQRQVQVAAALQRLQALRQTAANQRSQLQQVSANGGPYDQANIGMGLALGGGPFQPALRQRTPADLAGALSQTLQQQSQAEQDYNSLAQILAAGPVPAGSPIGSAPPLRLPSNPLLDSSPLGNEEE